MVRSSAWGGLNDLGIVMHRLAIVLIAGSALLLAGCSGAPASSAGPSDGGDDAAPSASAAAPEVGCEPLREVMHADIAVQGEEFIEADPATVAALVPGVPVPDCAWERLDPAMADDRFTYQLIYLDQPETYVATLEGALSAAGFEPFHGGWSFSPDDISDRGMAAAASYVDGTGGDSGTIGATWVAAAGGPFVEMGIIDYK